MCSIFILKTTLKRRCEKVKKTSIFTYHFKPILRFNQIKKEKNKYLNLGEKNFDLIS